jgi:hypothetical protein
MAADCPFQLAFKPISIVPILDVRSAGGKAEAKYLARGLAEWNTNGPESGWNSADDVSSEVRLGDDVFVLAKVTLKGLSPTR